LSATYSAASVSGLYCYRAEINERYPPAINTSPVFSRGRGGCENQLCLADFVTAAISGVYLQSRLVNRDRDTAG